MSGSWQRFRLEQCVDVMPCSYGTDLGQKPETAPVIKVSNVSSDGKLYGVFEERSFTREALSSLLAKNDDLLVVKSSGSKARILSGKTAIVNGEQSRKYVATNFLLRLHPKKEVVEPKLLWYILNSQRTKDFIKTIVGATTYPNLKWEQYRSLELTLPPLPIQKQIAAILEKADAAREKRRLANQLTEEFLQSAFLEMFGDPVTNPKGWEMSSIGDVADVKSGFAFRSQDYQESGIRLVRIANFSDSSLRFNEDSVRLPREFAKKYGEFLLKEEDVLIAMSGATTGKIGLVAKGDLPCLLNQRVGRFSIVNEEKLNASYLFYFLLRPSEKKRILELAGGSAQPNVSPTQLKMLRVPLPPINEQQKFAALVEKVESLRAKQRESEKELENLFNSLMQKAFRGELVE